MDSSSSSEFEGCLETDGESHAYLRDKDRERRTSLGHGGTARASSAVMTRAQRRRATTMSKDQGIGIRLRICTVVKICTMNLYTAIAQYIEMARKKRSGLSLKAKKAKRRSTTDVNYSEEMGDQIMVIIIYDNVHIIL